MDGGEAQGMWSAAQITSGEWAGWMAYGGDPFEDLTGPFYYRIDEAGAVVSAFRAQRRHMNASGAMHGGALMTFADYALFTIGKEALRDVGSVTVSLSGEFIEAAHEGDLVEARGDVVVLQLGPQQRGRQHALGQVRPRSDHGARQHPGERRG